MVIDLTSNDVVPMSQKLIGAFNAEYGHESLTNPRVIALV
jgi:hypothetical protein